MRVEEGDHLWHVVYTDEDSEDMGLQQLAGALVWHPSLSGAEEVVLPAPGSFVWFALEQRPCLGKVVSVDASSPRQLTVRLFEA